MKSKLSIIILLLCIAMLQPMPGANSQTVTQPQPKSKVELLKESISANMDTINTLVKEKVITLKKENATIRRKYYAEKNKPVVHDTLIIYIDTCIQIMNYDSLEIYSPESQKKLKWYQKIFKKNGHRS